jgi:predicted ABC-type sugar transport system permease subunit
VASVANAAGILVAFFTAQEAFTNMANLPLPGGLAILLALAGALALGSVTAFGVTRIGIPSFIMTLAMLQIAAGVCALLVRGQIAYNVPPVIKTLGSGAIGPVPWIVVVAGLFLLVGHIVLTYTRFGRYVYMVGGNREAAEYSGVNVRLIIAAVMIISAVLQRRGRDARASPTSAAPSRTSSTTTCSTRSRPWWSAAPRCSAARAASATRSSACSCWACSTTASTTSTSTASSRS